MTLKENPSARYKRSLSEEFEKVEKYTVELKNKVLTFNLEHEDDFVLPNVAVQHFSGNFTWFDTENLNNSGTGKYPNGCYYRGTIEGDEGSVASFTLCDGLVSDVRDFEAFLIPLKTLPNITRGLQD